MKRRLLGLLSLTTVLATVSLVAQGQPQIASPNLTPSPAQLNQKAKVQNVPEIPYDSVPNFIKLPDNLYLGEGIGVATNSKGHVFVYTRSGATRLFEFDETGKFVKEWGQNAYGFSFAHAIRFDKDDNLFVIDEGSNMVIKVDPTGLVSMVLGRKPESIDWWEEHVEHGVHERPEGRADRQPSAGLHEAAPREIVGGGPQQEALDRAPRRPPGRQPGG